MRATQQQLNAVFDEAALLDFPLIRQVMQQHMRAITALDRVTLELRELGEHRWADAYASRVADLEVQARRHLQAIVARHKAQQQEANRADNPK